MRRQQQLHQQHQDQLSRVFDDLSSLVLNLLRSPPSPIQFLDQAPALAPQPTAVSSSRRRPSSPQISPAGFVSLMLGISVALMLCGWLTFFIGFILMPWIIGLFMVFCVAGIVSSLSMLGRSIFCHATAPASPRKEIPAWKTVVKWWFRELGKWRYISEGKSPAFRSIDAWIVDNCSS